MTRIIKAGSGVNSFTTNTNLSNGANDIVHSLGTENLIVSFFKADDAIDFDYEKKAGSETTTITITVIGVQNDVDINIIGL